MIIIGGNGDTGSGNPCGHHNRPSDIAMTEPVARAPISPICGCPVAGDGEQRGEHNGGSVRLFWIRADYMA